MVEGKKIPLSDETVKGESEAFSSLKKLCTVAKYVNGDWLPSGGALGVQFYTNKNDDVGLTSMVFNYGGVQFKSREAAERALEILGEDEIRKALTLNH